MDTKTLLITGASSGIGAETARQAAAAGWNVALAARRADKLADLVSNIGEDRALAVSCDVQDPTAQETMVSEAVERFGGIDALFANAGRGIGPGKMSGGDVDDWRDLLMTNVYGVLLSVHFALPHLKQSRGQVVLTGSAAGRRAIAGSVYGVTKWAVTGLGYNLREELRGTGVRVMLLEPGMVDTPFFDDPKPDALRPDDIARTVVWALQQPPHMDLHEVLVYPTPPEE